MVNPEQQRIALHKPQTPYCLRPIELKDASVIQSCLWQHRSIDEVQDFIKRVVKFREQKRGLGIVVVNHNDSAQSIVAYGQATKWLKCAEISDLLVSPAHRSMGIGTAMIQYLTHYMVNQEVDCIELGVADSNPRAKKLYLALGFQESYTLQLNLGQGHEPVVYLRLNIKPGSLD